MFEIFKSVLGFFLPGGLVCLAALFILQKGLISPWLPQIKAILPYATLSLGLFLGLRFHQSRLAFSVILFIFSDRLLYYFGPGGMIHTGNETIILHGVALLLPVNIILLTFAKDRGILNAAGRVRLSFLLIQPAIIYILLIKNPELLSYINRDIIAHPSLSMLDTPQVIIIFYGLILAIYLVMAFRSKKAIFRGFFWAMLVGAVGLYWKYRQTEETIFFSIAGIILIMSMLEKAYAMAYHDELTGLPARRSLNRTLQNLGRNYTIAMLDIDFFKKFNDKYGHDVGDQVLCMVASHISKVGGGGKFFRYGGEEFTVVFPGKTKKDARPYLESLRESIAKAQFKVRGKDRPKKPSKTKRKTKKPKGVSVTISIGAAEPSGKVKKPGEVIKAADKALYRAKKKGRNCTVT